MGKLRMKTGFIDMLCFFCACMLFFPAAMIAGELRNYDLPSEKGYRLQTPQTIDRTDEPDAQSLSETDRKFVADLQKAVPDLSKEQINKLVNLYREKLSSAQNAGNRYSATFYKRLLEILSSCQGGNQP